MQATIFVVCWMMMLAAVDTKQATSVLVPCMETIWQQKNMNDKSLATYKYLHIVPQKFSNLALLFLLLPHSHTHSLITHNKKTHYQAMKFFVAISVALAATAVSAAPLVAYGENPSSLLAPGSNLNAKIDKLQLGGLSTPSAFSSTLNTEKAPINYGNLNMGTGHMPSQVVHYGSEYQPDHASIAPHLISTTAKEASFQVAKADKAKNLVNAEFEAGLVKHKGPTTLIDEDHDEGHESKFAPWWYGRYRGWGWGGWGPWGWGPWGRPWGWRRPIYY